jgi:NNP family nitrate/nitrite transporter-like MFS transporter
MTGPAHSEAIGRSSIVALTASTIAFTACFAAWMLNGVLVTFLVDNRIFPWTGAQMGTLIAAPVLSGSVLRLPAGLATDRFGGRPVFPIVMILAAIPMALLSFAHDYTAYLLCSLGFGLVGTGFAVGIAFTSVWFPGHRQGLALGIFGAGNAGAALTTFVAPSILRGLTEKDVERWRLLPLYYAAMLVAVALAFFLVTTNRLPVTERKTLAASLAPLRQARVWRFSLYYFLVFGGFVALAQWLVPYYVNVYGTSIVTAGLFASMFSLPSGVVRAAGGWLSDRFGARTTLLWVFRLTALACLLLFFPRMDIESPGRGVMAARSGVVTEVTARHIAVDDVTHPLRPKPPPQPELVRNEQPLVMPVVRTWHEPVVMPGESVRKKQLLARGVTHIYFQANIWIFSALVLLIGFTTGVGKAAVYKFIPQYYPDSVGVVGGVVGVIGGLGGFVCPIIFGYLLDWIGLWTSTWMFLFLVTVACLVWFGLTTKRLSVIGPS